MTQYTQQTANVLRKEAADAMEKHTKASIHLARVLFEVAHAHIIKNGHEEPVYLSWGHDSFDDFVEQELGMHESTARSYVLVYDELCVRRDFPDGHLPNSIQKLRLLAKISRRVKDARELNRWIGKARELGACQLEAEAEEAFGFGGEGGRHSTVGFRLKWKAIEPVMRAIRLAKEEHGLANNGEALVAIVNDWKEARKPASSTRIRRAG